MSRNTQSGGASTGRYQAIQEMIEEGYTISELVKAAKISRQAYYKWLKREPSIRELQDNEILKLIRQIEQNNKQSVGYGKMTRLIKRSGLRYLVNKKRIIRIMNEHGIKADYRQAKRKRVKERQTYQAENILNREFKQAAANQVWVTDTTELSYNIRNYKVRLHVVLDLYGQYPVSWLITPTETSEGAIKVFKQAQEREGALAPLIHTDRGTAYTSKAFNQYLANNNSQHSYSAPGTPADNAVIEHWWADFKAIWMAHSTKPQTLDELKSLVAEGIEYFTNTFISAKRNDLTATEFRYGKAN
ncbi:IS3 family transposase [Limosilactobacillus albertensis]|uniref:IS3 family transposase n=1 Tax=Limosilactobacillus albertensis TaxID=2759752 RepID=UPI001E3B7D85|nr:IS3 family transposase [Limosilactobacillus albertensis]MCD7117467.1 IS3 family transposase [Limosilactobacillus albertensis]MCD7117586.1 IS3 family transposase [Limosilactobacillus albertensis]MCD7117702.1 IS3 family transposase [Limosilactobacillus albertensis]MCD7117811.1 IS3 family transposase [Limosilactobacillus albertensis]MCD7117839.1 IS3 family transposase [Limosilactobacillus albertensis]